MSVLEGSKKCLNQMDLGLRNGLKEDWMLVILFLVLAILKCARYSDGIIDTYLACP